MTDDLYAFLPCAVAQRVRGGVEDGKRRASAAERKLLDVHGMEGAMRANDQL